MSPTSTSADPVNQSFIPSSRAFEHAETVAAGVRFHYLHQGTGLPCHLALRFSAELLRLAQSDTRAGK